MEQNKAIEVLTDLIDIPLEVSYTGYLWYSDNPKPDSYHCQQLPQWRNTNNPYIIEANFIDGSNTISYSIKYIDGQYVIIKFDLDKLHRQSEHSKFLTKSYLGNRIDKVQHLSFEEFWEKEADQFCLGMDVLVPASVVFVGFDK